MRAILGSLDQLGDASSAAALLAALRRLPEIDRGPRQRVAYERENERRIA
jgi:hypothetical protein